MMKEGQLKCISWDRQQVKPQFGKR